MEKYIEFKKSLIEEMVSKGAYEFQVLRALACESWDELKVVIADNIEWIYNNKVNIPNDHYKSNLVEFTIVNRLLHGQLKAWYSNGQLKVQEHYKNGLRHGESKCFYENGQLWVHSHFVNGLLDGECKWVYENGQLWVHSHYENWLLHGEYKEYCRDGKLREHSHYKNGKKIV